MAIYYHQYDLPADVATGPVMAVDTETMGLNLVRDRLCVVQLSFGNGDAHVVHFPTAVYDAPNLKSLCDNPAITKLFHYGRFDIAVLHRYLGVLCRPVWCTKIASKLVRTNTERHGLKDLCKELLGVDLSKQQQCSDWGASALTEDQVAYAASDVLYLHGLQAALKARLVRDERLALSEACFGFLPVRAVLDIGGWDQDDIFAH